MTSTQGMPPGPGSPINPVPGAPGGKPKRQWETRDIARLVAALVIVALLVAFVIDNSQKVKVGFVFFNANVALIWVLIVTALLGAIADRLVAWRRSQQRRAAAKAAAKR